MKIYKYFIVFIVFSTLISCKKNKIPDNPGRIVSLSPSLTQIVFALGEGKRIVAVTKYDFYPPEVKKLPVAGGFLDVGTERILSFKPHLVLLSEMHGKLASKLKETGIPVLVLKTRNISETFETIRKIARKLRVVKKGAKLIKDLKHSLTPLKCTKKNRILVTLGHLPGSLKNLVAAGHGTYLDEIIRLAGGENALPSGPASYPALSSEELISIQPDIILDISLKKDSSPWNQVNFKKKPEIYVLTDPRYSSPGIFFPFILKNFHSFICKK